MATRYIKIEWRNTCDIGGVFYEGTFRNKVFFEGEILMPSFEYVEEGNTDKDGVFRHTYQQMDPVYSIQVYVPQYLVEALSAIPLHDDVRISYTDETYGSSVRNVVVTVDTEEISNGCMALVNISFKQDDQIVKDSCCI